MTREEVYRAFNLDRLPSHMRDGLWRYLQHGIKPGGFATAVLENNLVEAYGRADETNAACMKDWAGWLYNNAPRGCWGDPGTVQEWMSHRGLSGLEEKMKS